MQVTEAVEITGHLMDSGVLARILDDVLDYGGDYTVDRIDLGKAHQRRRRRKIIGTDRARGQGRANKSAEYGGAVSRRVAIAATTAATPKLCRPQHGLVHSNSPTRRGPEQRTSACSSADVACTNHLRMVSPCGLASELSAGHASDR